MSIQDLEQRIAIRANEQVQKKIAAFKKSIDDALTALFGQSGMGGEQFGQLGYFEGSARASHEIGRNRLAGLKLAICDYKTTCDHKVLLPWPSKLWEDERNAIRKELLDKMDMMQRLLVATAKPSDTDAPEQGNEAQ